MNKSLHVFVGPSGPLEPGPYICHPPARYGDIFKLSKKGAQVIVLIDAVLMHSPGPTHLELLEVLGQGVTIVGAASTGALRAAELGSQGMLGLGTIFNAYNNEYLTDDSELCVAMSSRDFRALSLPLVRIRAALASSLALGLSKPDVNAALSIAEEIHFMERTPSDLIRQWYSCLPLATADTITGCLKSAHSDVKQRDAQDAVNWAIAGLPPDRPDVAAYQTVLYKPSHA